MYTTRLFSFFVTLLFLLSAVAFSAEVEKENMIMVKTGDHFRLGVVVSDVNKDKHEVKVDEGAYVLNVMEDSPAEKAGIKKGDVIVNFEESKITNAEDLEISVSEIDEPKEVTVTVNREGKEQSFKAKPEKITGEKSYTVTIDDGDFDFHIDDLPKPGKFDVWIDKQDGKGGFLGVQAQNISESMLSYFEVDYGVLVEEIVDDSPAQKAGLKAGDVITKINDRVIKDYDDLIRTLNYYNPEEKITVYYSRKGGKQNVSVTLGEKKGSARNIRLKKMLKGDKDLKWIDADDKLIDIREERGYKPGFRFFGPDKGLNVRVI